MGHLTQLGNEESVFKKKKKKKKKNKFIIEK
jgi:hypothetical protein